MDEAEEFEFRRRAEAEAAAGTAAPPAAAPAAPEQSVLDKVKNYLGSIDFSIGKQDVSNVGKALKRTVDLPVKGVNDAVIGTASLPGNVLADAVNRVAGTNITAPGKSWQDFSDSTIAPAQNLPEQLLKEGAGFFAGSKIPIPGMQAAPAATNPTQKVASAMAAREAGYAIPNSAVKPTATNGVVEALLGRKQLYVDATRKNTAAMSRNVGDELGLPKGTEITHDTLDAVRNEAGKAYEAIKSLGPQYDQLVEHIKSLRSDASGYYRQVAGQYNHDVAQKADELWGQAQHADNVLEGALKQSGDSAAYDAYIAARQKIAQTHDVEKALVESRGELKPNTFKKLYEKDKPISGAILDAGRSTEAFPEAFNTKAKMGGFNGLDSLLLGSGVGMYELAHQPGLAVAMAAAAAARKGGRMLALSPMMQSPEMLTAAEKKAALAESLLRGAQSSTGER